MGDNGWDRAMAGCDYVLHVASPLGADAKDPGSLLPSLARAPCDLRRESGELARALGDAELREDERVAAERVRLDDVAADLEVGLVDLLDDVRARLVDQIDAVLLA
jgi:hypothetical protein